ncbi:cobyric acid synthase CobQ [Synechocystis sp. FACHB-383]|uniref:cobyric acid synthase CobQ n=1 Tax=Synechocystis sp. FACHB-383 TaxID=2692864 RepID=UPI001687DDB1|nr:cobyric acid synthase CobQ [Synechocystis sp. FACHB-383]MBD2652354.1 cobyric acid synthase CobQ [Synechocystis sp. FACHB-383]
MKAIMVVGTTSHAGKSFLTTGLCRLLHRRGYRVTPFKGQNMALNAFVTVDGGEMGHAQAVQAWAAGTVPRVAMNPILLKPQGDMTSQVIMLGKAVGTTRAQEYYQNYFDRGWQAIAASLEILAQDFDVVVCEGAGSPAEINLKHRDLTNMRVASHLQAATILIADIDRGGVFAHVVGTLQLLEPEERKLIKGIVINKFRGQRSLLDSGITWLEEYTGIPVLGVIPYGQNLFSAEDSLDLLERSGRPSPEDIRIVVLRLPRIANFTDFEPLEAESGVYVDYLPLEKQLGKPDAVIIPGSKTTIADLQALQNSGMGQQIMAYVQAGGTVMGICGGYQMLGQTIADPENIEGSLTNCQGLGLFPLTTVITQEKITRQQETISYAPQPGLRVTGYEIHQGISRRSEHSQDFLPLFDQEELGMVNGQQNLWGCYLHGLFDNGTWRRCWLNNLRQRRGLGPLPTAIGNYQEQREAMLNSLADFVETHVNLNPILSSFPGENSDTLVNSFLG